MNATALFALSIVAGVGMVAMLVPQVLRTWRQGISEDVSPGLFVLSGIGNLLWAAYAVHRQEWALLAVTVLAVGLSVWQLALFAQTKRRRNSLPSLQRRGRGR